jgi:hypothetical protein
MAMGDQPTNVLRARLEGWWVAMGDSNAFTAPEMTARVLVGLVYNHRTKPDGAIVRTSTVVHASGRTVRTATGSVYTLGEPSAEYRVWLAEHRPHWDPENPVTVFS